MILGKCPYCEDGEIEVRKKEVRGKKSSYMLVAMLLGKQKMANFLNLQLIQNVVLRFGKIL